MDPKRIKELIDLLRLDADQTGTLGMWEVLFALALSLVCSIVVAKVYRRTHPKTASSQAFVQTLVLTSMVTTLIMIVIGSNIARAFSLVGALSIIRFRNAVKETRDVGYIFFTMAIAMAAGTRFYGVAILATGVISATMLTFHAIGFGASSVSPEQLLRVTLPPKHEVETLLGETLRRLFDAYSVVRMESVRDGLNNRVTLSVRPKQGTTSAAVIEAIGAVTEGLKVTYGTITDTE